MTVDPMITILLVIVLLVAISFWRMHKDLTVNFDLLDLLMENGRVSKVACMVLGAYTVHTWIMVQLTIEHRLTENYMGIYAAAWIAPLIAKMFAPIPTSTTSTSVEVTKTETTK